MAVPPSSCGELFLVLPFLFPIPRRDLAKQVPQERDRAPSAQDSLRAPEAQSIVAERARVQSAQDTMELERLKETQNVQAQWMQQLEEDKRKMGAELTKAASKEIELQRVLQSERNNRDQERSLLTSRESSEIACAHGELSGLRSELTTLTQVREEQWWATLSKAALQKSHALPSHVCVGLY
jgi:hypothetical protein